MASTQIKYHNSKSFLLVVMLGLVLIVLQESDIQLIKATPTKAPASVSVEVLSEPQPETPPSKPEKNAQIAESNTGGSSSPMLIGKIDMDFLTYLSQIERLGGGLFVYQPQDKKFVANINATGRLVEPRSRKGMSAKARNVSNDIPPALRQQWEKSFQKKSSASRDYLILLPKPIESKINQSIKQLIENQGMDYSKVKTINFSYSQGRNGLSINLKSLKTPAGEVLMNAGFNL